MGEHVGLPLQYEIAARKRRIGEKLRIAVGRKPMVKRASHPIYINSQSSIIKREDNKAYLMGSF